MKEKRKHRKVELVVLAAGLSTRFGAPKQLEPMDDYGNTIIDFSIYDALQVGFSGITFVVREEMKGTLKNRFSHLENKVEIKYAIQKTENEKRKKPWGTAHALLPCKDIVNTPFAVINCDDYYGREAMKNLFSFLKNTKDDWALMGYPLDKTLPESGGVARAVCKTSPDHNLIEVVEQKEIVKIEGGCKSLQSGARLESSVPVSMNMWGFTPSIFPLLESYFKDFLKETANPLIDEFYLPTAINKAITQGRTVKILETAEDWIGITHPEDKKDAVNKFAYLKEKGYFPNKLWN